MAKKSKKAVCPQAVWEDVPPAKVLAAVNRVAWLLERQVLALEVIADLIKDSGSSLAAHLEGAKLQVQSIRESIQADFKRSQPGGSVDAVLGR